MGNKYCRKERGDKNYEIMTLSSGLYIGHLCRNV
jgi:hypothetical protein